MKKEELKKEITVELVGAFDDDIVFGESHYLDILYKFEVNFKRKVYEFVACPFESFNLSEDIENAIDEFIDEDEYITATEIIDDLMEFDKEDYKNIVSQEYIIERGIICGSKDDEKEIEAAQELFDDFRYELPAVLYCDKEIEAICGYLVQIDYTNNRVSHSALVTKALLEAVERNIEKADYISISDLEYYNAWLDVIREFE